MGATSSLQYGVPINPRIDFARNKSKKENQAVRIDVPKLVDLNHGSVRYRYTHSSEKSGKGLAGLVEKPYEGTQFNNKKNYFFHHKLPDGEKIPDDLSWKSCYVYKGPERARQKQLFYVFGKGLKVNEDGFVEPYYKPEEQSFQRPIFYKVHSHIYYELIFLREGGDQTEAISVVDSAEGNEEMKMEVGENSNKHSDETSIGEIEMLLPVATSIADLKTKIAGPMGKTVQQVHLFMHGTKLRSEEILGKLNAAPKEQKDVSILLHLK